MKAGDLRQLKPDELDARVSELRSQLFNLRIKDATQQLDDRMRRRTTRRDLARALTVISEQARAAKEEVGT